MSNKYLIDKEEAFNYNGQELFQKSDAKEVEVLEEKQLRDNLFADTDIPIESLFKLSDYLKANNYIILKIKE